LSIWIILVTAPAAAQDTQPDYINLDHLTTLEVMLVELPEQHRTSAGVEGTVTVDNPLLTYYLDYQLTDPDGLASPNSRATEIWDLVGLIPPRGLNFTAPAPPITYTVRFTSSSQSVRITSRILSAKSIVFNSLVVATNWLPVLRGVQPRRLAEALTQIPDWSSRVLALAENLDCFANEARPLADLDNCLIGIAKIFHNPLFYQLVSDVAQAIGVNIRPETVATFLKVLSFIDRLSTIADAVAYAFTLPFGGSTTNEYTLQPVTTDLSLLPPWSPQLIAPIGNNTSISPRFEWGGRCRFL
jgi:hypothetical protein